MKQKTIFKIFGHIGIGLKKAISIDLYSLPLFSQSSHSLCLRIGRNCLKLTPHSKLESATRCGFFCENNCDRLPHEMFLVSCSKKFFNWFG